MELNKIATPQLYHSTSTYYFLISFHPLLQLMDHSHPRMTALPSLPPSPSPCRDARLVWSAPPLSYVSAMVVPIGRRSNDSACLPLCVYIPAMVHAG